MKLIERIKPNKTSKSFVLEVTILTKLRTFGLLNTLVLLGEKCGQNRCTRGGRGGRREGAGGLGTVGEDKREQTRERW